MRATVTVALVAALLTLSACDGGSATGTWSGTVTTPGNTRGSPMLLTLIEGTFEKDRFTGTWLGPGATEPATVVLRRE